MGFQVIPPLAIPEKGLSVPNMYTTARKRAQIGPHPTDPTKRIITSTWFWFASKAAYDNGDSALFAETKTVPIDFVDLNSNAFTLWYEAVKGAFDPADIIDDVADV